MSGGAVLIGGGVAQGVTAIMKGHSTVAQFAAMLGADVITDATLEFLTTKQITWEGMVFTVLLSTISNAAQLKQIKKTADVDIKSLQKSLIGVLESEHCPMPDFMKLIPENASEQEIITFLQKMFHESKFFSRVSTCEIAYGKNFEFAHLMSEICDNATGAISRGKSFDEVLDQIAKGYSKETTINTTQTERIGKSGIYRGSHTKPANYLEVDGIKLFRLDIYETGYGVSGAHDGYKAYVKRLDNTLSRTSPYEDFTLTKIIPSNPSMRHPYHDEVAKNMDIISERYMSEIIENERIQADNIISEIYYLVANTCPFQRGSNGISDVLMRSQYSALGIDMPHVKSGVGLDLEAFCMDLKDYQMKWKTFFE